MLLEAVQPVPGDYEKVVDSIETGLCTTSNILVGGTCAVFELLQDKVKYVPKYVHAARAPDGCRPHPTWHLAAIY